MTDSTPCGNCGLPGWTAWSKGWCQHTCNHLWTGSGQIHPRSPCSKCTLTYGEFVKAHSSGVAP